MLPTIFIKKIPHLILLNNINDRFIISNIVAPHGITDISHSIESNNFKNLININLTSMILINLLDKINLNLITNITFLILSIIHFKDDFGIIKKKKVTASFFVFSLLLTYHYFSLALSLNIFLFYMTIIHVPLHYKKNWWHIKKNKYLNSFFLMMVSLITNNLYYNYSLYSNIFLCNFIKSIIISHIIYNENFNKDNNDLIDLI